MAAFMTCIVPPHAPLPIGLSAAVDMDAIEAQLAKDGACTTRRLVGSALAGGGPDNVSVALVRVDASGADKA